MSTPIPDEKIAELSQLIFHQKKIEAIKLHREVTGLGLKESKEAIEKMEVMLRKEVPEKFTSSPADSKSSGCFGAAAACLVSAAGLISWIIVSGA